MLFLVHFSPSKKMNQKFISIEKTKVNEELYNFVNNIFKSYKGRKVVNDISLSCQCVVDKK